MALVWWVAGGCSNVAASAGDDALVVPEGLTVMALPGGNGVLELIALTLQEGDGGAELFAALRNEGDVPACSAAFSVELFDRAEQSVASGISGLLTQRHFQLEDDSGTIAACVAPGDVTMAAVTDLPAELAIDDVGTVVYRCPYHALDVTPIDGLAIDDVKRVAKGDETSFTGTLVNELDVAVKDPSVTVFPVNRAGRPLGVATAQGSLEVPAGETWRFETAAVRAAGVDHVAFPAFALQTGAVP